MISGEPGIGKTSLLEAASSAARELGFRVLAARPSEAEVELSFAAMADLIDSLGPGALDGLPAPQRMAIEVALTRTAPVGRPPEPLAIATALLALLRGAAAQGAAVIAIDDAQWLDTASANALSFAARRLAGAEITFIAAARLGSVGLFEQTLVRAGAVQFAVEPLSFTGIRRLLAERFELALPTQTLRPLFALTKGNPLFALELGRSLHEHQRDDFTAEDFPDGLATDVFRPRILSLSSGARRALLAVALSPSATPTELAAAIGEQPLAAALRAQLIAIDRGRVRPAHPLLAAAAIRHSIQAQRREIHGLLAAAVRDEPRSAHHLAQSTAGPDTAAAETVAAAAGIAMARGATYEAVELAREALVLTPEEAPVWVDRLLLLAEYQLNAGELQGVRALLTANLEAVPRGSLRARALLLLAEATEMPADTELLDRALAESQDEASLAARALALKVREMAVNRIERIDEAVSLAERGLIETAGADADALRWLTGALHWARLMGGLPVHGQSPDHGEIATPGARYEWSTERQAAIQLVFRGELESARQRLLELSSRALDVGEMLFDGMLRLQLCEVALRTGDSAAAAAILAEWDEHAIEEMECARLRCEALLAAVTGDSAAVVQRSEVVIGRPDARRWDYLEVQRARGLAALLDGDHELAAERLGAVWEYTNREGVDDPGAFPVAGDLVHALAAAGRTGEAARVTERLRELAERLDHPWGLATTARCEAVLRLSSGFDPAAAEALEGAAKRYGELGLRFDQARSLLSLGGSQRRGRRRGAARASLERASAVFGQLGAEGWAQAARSELSRVGGRPVRDQHGLTPAEERAARLAAEGQSNKQIAAVLVVSIHTVEVHLSRAYAKLGINSRNQLSRVLAAPSPDQD